MSDFGITEKSRPLVVTAYQPQWVDDFRQIATRIRDLVGNTAVRIDHIGSTAVPALAAKDVIDIQISLPALDSACGVTNPLRKRGFAGAPQFSTTCFTADLKQIRNCANSSW